MKIFSLSHTETLIDRLLEILAGISRTIRFCVLHDISFYALRSCEDNFKIPTAFTSKKKNSVVSKVFHSLSGLLIFWKMALTGLTTPTVRGICTFAIFFSNGLSTFFIASL